jgi:hypothetical protein
MKNFLNHLLLFILILTVGMIILVVTLEVHGDDIVPKNKLTPIQNYPLCI